MERKEEEGKEGEGRRRARSEEVPICFGILVSKLSVVETQRGPFEGKNA